MVRFDSSSVFVMVLLCMHCQQTNVLSFVWHFLDHHDVDVIQTDFAILDMMMDRCYRKDLTRAQCVSMHSHQLHRRPLRAKKKEPAGSWGA